MTSTPKELRATASAQIRKRTFQGTLLDRTFTVFQRTVYPGAPPDQVAGLRIAFFAAAQESHALLLASMDEGEDPTDGDLEFMSQWQQEIEDFHERTIAAMQADGSRK